MDLFHYKPIIESIGAERGHRDHESDAHCPGSNPPAGGPVTR